VSTEAPTLRKYQVDTLQSVVAARRRGRTRLLVKKPTGTGKTVTFSAMPTWPELVPGSKSGVATKMLVIAHREELLTQAAAKIRAAQPELRVDIEQADLVASRFADVVVASIQTLAASKFKRLERLMGQHGTFNLVIVDEAHHAAAPTYRGALARLGFLPFANDTGVPGVEWNAEAATWDDVATMEAELQGWDARAPKDRLLVGVTATPNRTDAIGLNCVFQEIAYSYGLKQAIDDGWLVKITPWVVETKSNLDDVRVRAGEFVQSELADAVNNSARNALAVAAWREHADGLSTIAFSVDVAHAHAIADTFTADGVVAQAISGETDKVLRRQYLEAYTRGDITVLANCMVLTEGTDLPRTGCILHCKPTKSPTLYEQMTGRGLRIHPGKTECVVIDLVDVTRRHSLQAAPVLYGLPPNLVANGKTLDEFAELIEKFLEEHPGINIDGAGLKTLEQLNAIARTFDIWKIPSMEGFGTSMKWIRLEDERFKLQYPWTVGGQEGTEAITVERNLLGLFEASVTWRQHVAGAHPSYPEVVASGATAHEALKLAEGYVQRERRVVSRLTDRDAPWRQRPASDKQKQLLSKWKVPYKPGVTMGEASELIDLAQSRRRR
jgi:ATP-dependent helicase IRC3